MPIVANQPEPRRAWIAGLLLAAAVLLPLCLLLGVDLAITIGSRGQIYDDLAGVPPAPVALVLGTSSRQHGRPNPFYEQRIEAAARLFHAGRVRAILVSGDNATLQYNEPWTMRADLLELGVPEEYITLDYAGFRTLDSIVRAKVVFQQDELIIVSQRFHVARALFLARHAGIQATAFAVANPPVSGYLRIRVREIFARIAAVFDVLSGRGPRFLGDPEPVPLKPVIAPQPE